MLSNFTHEQWLNFFVIFMLLYTFCIMYSGWCLRGYSEAIKRELEVRNLMEKNNLDEFDCMNKND